MNTDGRVMAWLMDTVSMAHGEAITASVTGKPLAIGGTAQHAGGTAAGVVMCTRDVFEELGLPLVGRARSSRASARSGVRWRSCCTRRACASSR